MDSEQVMNGKIEAFNNKYSVGDTVTVTDDLGNQSEDIIKYPATILGGHTPMAWLVHKGSYLLDRVR